MDYIKVSTNPKHYTFIALAFMVHSMPLEIFWICVHFCFRCGERMPSCGQIGSGPFQPLQYYVGRYFSVEDKFSHGNSSKKKILV